MYKIMLEKKAQKDSVLIERAGFKIKVDEIIKTVRRNPYENSQGFEVLRFDLKGMCSRRINRQHRFFYEVLPNDSALSDTSGKPYDGIVKVISMWDHYY
jgi:Txe/YoeB family toxin of toxin-antitoxin system